MPATARIAHLRHRAVAAQDRQGEDERLGAESFMDASAIVAVLREAVPDASIDAIDGTDMPSIAVDREHLIETCGALRDHPSLQFALLADVTAVDKLPESPRYEVVYHLACLGEHFPTAGNKPVAPARLRMKVRLTGEDARIP